MRFFWAMTLVAVFALFSGAAFAANIDGKWVAEFTTPNGDTRTQTYNFKADGDKLTGTISSQMGEREISDGKINGDEISFVLKVEMNGESRTIPYTGKVSGDEIKLKMKFGERERDITAKRVKS